MSQIVTPAALPSFGIAGLVDVMMTNILNARDVLGDISALPFLLPFSFLLNSINAGVYLNYIQNCSYCLKENTTCFHCKNQVLIVFSENGFEESHKTHNVCRKCSFLMLQQVVYMVTIGLQKVNIL